ncbi:Amidase [Candidatus Koribacter versatilis Ellin345]|uniref:Amidase n=1 Tax=Koribacter versatilis (strain Ellin345) TaxID=204669 RepID=Q1IR14_KORVE|nr:amidase [Candidatus Koribacter versatilis]ABF40686.1 Amidase [Candidatus Koribacter versatilis Ellin345]
MSGLTTRSATELLELLRKKKLSPLELVEEHIHQIERLNPKLNALVDFDPERVRAQARKVSAHEGPLAGLPVTVKSSIAVAGHKCELGSGFYRNNIPSEDATVVARMRAAGAVILGTTNAPELLMSYETANDLYGRTLNPWNIEYSAGGSSGGESAAIAAGMSAAGLGSDSGGSVRQPAHATGICALKPTPGRIPATGHIPACLGPFATLGAIGPMARTMQDVSLLFSVLSGQDLDDPASAPVPLCTPSITELKQIPIGYFEDDGIVPVTPETRFAIQSAVDALRRAGFRVEPFRPRTLEAARKIWWTFFVRCGFAFDEAIIQGRYEKLSPTFKDFMATAQAEPPLESKELLFAWAEGDMIRAKMLAEMRDYPVWLCPVCAIPAFRHDEREWIVEGKTVQYLDAMRYMQWFNTFGAPAAVVPVGASPEGLPIGVQIAARPYADEIVLGIAEVIDREFGYRVPPIAES